MIHQFVPSLHTADAVGNHTMKLQEALQARGMNSEIFVENPRPDTMDRTHQALEYMANPDGADLLVYQFATAARMASLLPKLGCRIAVNYHGITPPWYFTPWDGATFHHQDQAYRQLGDLASSAAVAVADSEFLRSELTARGFRKTFVISPSVRLIGNSTVRTTDHHSRSTRWLSVGRLAPNKRVEATLAALFVYRRRYDADARLTVVGRTDDAGYQRALFSYVAELGLTDAVRFMGSVSDEALDSAYADSDVLVVSSIHEGFCVPVVEAMSHRLPVVACREGALPEVVGSGGILLDSVTPAVVAKAVYELWTSQHDREKLIASAETHLASMMLDSSAERLADLFVATYEEREFRTLGKAH